MVGQGRVRQLNEKASLLEIRLFREVQTGHSGTACYNCGHWRVLRSWEAPSTASQEVVRRYGRIEHRYTGMQTMPTRAPKHAYCGRAASPVALRARITHEQTDGGACIQRRETGK